MRFSFGYPLTEPVRQALLCLEESAWRPAIDLDGQERDGAWVTELTGQVNLADWPEDGPSDPHPIAYTHTLTPKRPARPLLTNRG